MLRLCKHGSVIALLSLAACNSGGGGLTPLTSLPAPQNAGGLKATAAKRHHESPLAGVGPAIQIASFTPPVKFNEPAPGMTFAYGGVYFRYYGVNSRVGGVASFNGRYWNDYQSLDVDMASGLALDSDGDIYSLIYSNKLLEVGIVKYNPHAGTESREFIAQQADREIGQVNPSIAVDAQNRLWFEGCPPENEDVYGVVSKPGTPQQVFKIVDDVFPDEGSAFDLPQWFARGADGAIWASGESCGAYYDCTAAMFRFDPATPRLNPLTTYDTLVPSTAGPIALGPDSRIWFVLPSASEIGRINTSGAIDVFKIPPTKGASTFRQAKLRPEPTEHCGSFRINTH